jgi:hypothetical protein
VTGQPFDPSFSAAMRYVAVQEAILRSVESGRWEDVADTAGRPSPLADQVSR